MWQCILQWVEAHPGLASWVQAIGAIFALALAIYIPWKQHRDEIAQGRIDEAGELHTLRARLVAAVQADIAAIDDTLRRRIEAASATNRDLVAAAAAGQPYPRKELRPGAHRISDKDIYTAVARDSVALSPPVLAEIIKYYTAISQVEYVCSLSVEAETLVVAQIQLIPELREVGQILSWKLQKYAAAGYKDGSDIGLTKLELDQTVRSVNPEKFAPH